MTVKPGVYNVHLPIMLESERQAVYRERKKDLIHTSGEEVNSTIIQCVHEQSLTGICIFPVFYLLPMDHLCTNR